ncbi:hypothetical protein GE278_20290 [Enterobacteriaceae bacterium Kacie_13]|nr:hypothetical protein GE278_20290 [Enterobacteriaceae bacterium Kacie_13]
MKLLKNEYEYRTWFINEYLSLDKESDPAILSPDEIETDLQAEMPEVFPCMVLLTPSKSLYASGTIQYYYRRDIISIGEGLGIIVNTSANQLSL